MLHWESFFVYSNPYFATFNARDYFLLTKSVGFSTHSVCLVLSSTQGQMFCLSFSVWLVIVHYFYRTTAVVFDVMANGMTWVPLFVTKVHWQSIFLRFVLRWPTVLFSVCPSVSFYSNWSLCSTFIGCLLVHGALCSMFSIKSRRIQKQ